LVTLYSAVVFDSWLGRLSVAVLLNKCV